MHCIRTLLRSVVGPAAILCLAAGCIAPTEPPVDPPTNPQCGGFAGLACPAGMTCVDDPNDDCDPARGGADCGGLCTTSVCEPALGARYLVKDPASCSRIRFTCEAGEQPFFDDCGCGCEPVCPVWTCGPSLGMPNRICPDGVTVAGPTGRCLPNPDGQCGWEVINCP